MKFVSQFLVSCDNHNIIIIFHKVYIFLFFIFNKLIIAAF